MKGEAGDSPLFITTGFLHRHSHVLGLESNFQWDEIICNTRQNHRTGVFITKKQKKESFCYYLRVISKAVGSA